MLRPQRERVHPHDHPSTSPLGPAAEAPGRLEGRGFLVGAWLPRWLRKLAATEAERAGRLGRRRLERARSASAVSRLLGRLSSLSDI